VARPPREHLGERQLRADDRAVQVDRELAACDFIGLLVERPDPVDACVVDHHLERTVARAGGIEERGELRRHPDIQVERERSLADLARRRLGPGEVDVADGDQCARGGQPPRDRAPDAVAAAGDGSRHAGEGPVALRAATHRPNSSTAENSAEPSVLLLLAVTPAMLLALAVDHQHTRYSRPFSARL
jgi:hypothetical protein